MPEEPVSPASEQLPQGERFSLVYLDCGKPTHDSERRPRHGFRVNAHLSCSSSSKYFLRVCAALGLVGTDETEREAAYDGYVLGAVTAAVAREIVLELDVEQPVHALDAPVTACSVSEPVDIERRRRDIEARLERAAIGIFDARVGGPPPVPKLGCP
jgi:hypothetical protein